MARDVRVNQAPGLSKPSLSHEDFSAVVHARVAAAPRK
jgi:hypothetical protein